MFPLGEQNEHEQNDIRALGANSERTKQAGMKFPTEIYEKASLATATPQAHAKDAQPINLKWAYGINCNIPAINLSDENRTTIAYSVAHVAVLYDYVNNQQKILQGHVCIYIFLVQK